MPPTPVSPKTARAVRRPSASAKPVKVTIVLPCYNERAHVMQEIERITTAMDASEHSYELFILDDGSTDGTREVLAKAAADFPSIRYLPLPRNGGSGTARRIGTQQGRGEIVVWTDADMTYPNERIPEFVQMLEDNPALEQVVGARKTEEGTYKIFRVPAKWAIRRICSFLTSTKIPDLNSGLRAFRRETSLPYLRLLPAGFSCVTTLTVAFLSNQHVVEYIPIDYAKRAGKSKFHPFRDAYKYILQVLRMVMYFNPLKILMPLALWIMFLATVKLIAVDVFIRDFRVTGSTILTMVIGFQIAALALIGDLIVKSRAE